MTEKNSGKYGTATFQIKEQDEVATMALLLIPIQRHTWHQIEQKKQWQQWHCIFHKEDEVATMALLLLPIRRHTWHQNDKETVANMALQLA